MPVPAYSKNGEMWLSDVKLYPTWRQWDLCPVRQSCRDAREKGSLRPTAECHFRDDEQVQAVQVVGVGSGEGGIGATQVAFDVADLGRKLQAPNPHLGLPLTACGLSVRWSGSALALCALATGGAINRGDTRGGPLACGLTYLGQRARTTQRQGRRRGSRGRA